MSLHRVVEVREGQKTDMFDKFPYEQVENQSFSLLYQKEGKHMHTKLPVMMCMTYLIDLTEIKRPEILF